MKKELKVGILAVISGVILFLGANFLKGKDYFTDDITYYVDYEDVDGLMKSNAVVVNGYTVGRVDRIKMLHDKGNKLRVTLSVNRDIVLGDSTLAELSDDGLLGGKVIVLNLGHDKTTFTGGEVLQSRTVVNIAGVIEKKAVPVIEKLDSVLASVRDIVDEGMENNLDSSVMYLKSTMKSFSEASLLFKHLILANDTKIGRITEGLASLTDSLNLVAGEMRPLITNLKSFSGKLDQLTIDSTLQKADVALVNIGSILKSINEGQGTMGKLIKEDSTYAKLNRTIESLDSLIGDIEANPHKYIHISVFDRHK